VRGGGREEGAGTSEDKPFVNAQGVHHGSVIVHTSSDTQTIVTSSTSQSQEITEILGVLEISHLSTSAQLDLLRQTTDIRGINLQDNHAEFDLGVTGLKRAEFVWVQNNPFVENLQFLSNLERTNDILIKNNPLLTDITALAGLSASYTHNTPVVVDIEYFPPYAKGQAVSLRSLVELQEEIARVLGSTGTSTSTSL
jgi:hypothetical protein